MPGAVISDTVIDPTPSTLSESSIVIPDDCTPFVVPFALMTELSVPKLEAADTSPPPAGVDHSTPSAPALTTRDSPALPREAIDATIASSTDVSSSNPPIPGLFVPNGDDILDC